jgi:hypothetical protein
MLPEKGAWSNFIGKVAVGVLWNRSHFRNRFGAKPIGKVENRKKGLLSDGPPEFNIVVLRQPVFPCFHDPPN